ncbi:MAG TPA: SDR family oxidoreductase [Candidatus Limnocylindrales bacterium]|nr:SDR family oxidoreductase [Candidatus Limnocylindrales bacterium]
MTGRVVLITGATSGLGLVAAGELARQGATVVLHGRDPERAMRARTLIHERVPSAAIEIVLADLSSQAEVRRLAAEIRERFPRLHVLINNAGGTFSRRQETVDGLELTFALNHLAPFLLTNLLLDVLQRSAPSRIVTVSSGAHQRAALDFDDLQNRRRYSGFRVYGQSKLCNLYFTYELARRLASTGVTANALHPGFVATNFGRNESGWLSLVMPIAHRFAISPQQGARTIVYLASSPEVEGVSGRYFYQERPVASSSVSLDRGAAQRLWTVSTELTRLDHTIPAPS